jgi:hypothetical protein
MVQLLKSGNIYVWFYTIVSTAMKFSSPSPTVVLRKDLTVFSVEKHLSGLAVVSGTVIIILNRCTVSE